MVYPPQEVCGAGTEAIQQFLCKGKARQPASFTQGAPDVTPGTALRQPGGWGRPRSLPAQSSPDLAGETGKADCHTRKYDYRLWLQESRIGHLV